MRILFLCKQYHIEKTPCRTVGRHSELKAGSHTWVRALASEQAEPGDLRFDLRRDTLQDIARRYPGGPPDVLLVWEPGYHGLPMGIENAPFPVVACYSDWNLGMTTQAGFLDAYEYLFTDRPGVRVLNRMGYDNVEFWQMWGHDPGFSRVLPGVEKEWDIGMVGNLNADVQRERAVWLARVAALADLYRVRIAGGVYGEEYTRMMNATRITFNRSIRSEANMRCFEAAACGSLLFMEEENEEIREFFQDGIHCVLYNDRNLEERLDHYLADNDARQRIIEAARERAAEFTFPRNLNRLAARLEELDLPDRMRHRRIKTVAVPELRKRHARQSAGWETLGCKEASVRFAAEAVAALPEDAAAHNDLAVTNSLLVPWAPDAATKARLTALSLRHAEEAMRLCPRSAFFRLNVGELYAGAEYREEALEHAQTALGLLDTEASDPADPLALPFPFAFNEYRVQYCGVYNTTRGEPERFELERKRVQLWRGGLLLGRAASELGLSDFAALGRRIAVTARPDLGSGRIELAQTLSERNAPEEALLHLESGLGTDPFLTRAWPLYAALLQTVAGRDACDAFLKHALTVLEAVAPSKEKWITLGSMLEMDEVRQELLALSETLAAAA